MATTISSSSSSSSSAAAAAAPITTSTMTTIKLGHKENCCQLFENSPGKLTQHLSSCMQLKTSPTIMETTTAKQQQQQQQQPIQQQYYQQRPDVMLMTTGHKLSSEQPTTMATACRMVLPPPLPPPSQHIQHFYGNAMPAMTTYHLVSSASANSSPTHQQSIRHYIVPQLTPPPPPPTSSSSSASLLTGTPSASVTGSQHFMAVPSSMLRFHHQTSPQTSIPLQQQQHQNSVNITSNININPLALPVSGSATVYFPIVTPATAGSQNSSQSLIKYHTIQMPHKRQNGTMLMQQTDEHDNQLINAVEDVDGSLFPPPPPPAYQTATVHGIRRAKFLAKPLPLEINNLLHESDISCRHDLSQNFTTFNNNSNKNSVNEQQLLVPTTVNTPTTTFSTVMLPNENPTKMETSMPAVATAAVSHGYGNSSITTNTVSSAIDSTAVLANTTAHIYENHESTTVPPSSMSQQQPYIANSQMGLILGSGAITSDDTASAPVTVDIMDDEDEQEQQRLGECNQGTPSRVPLLTSSSNSTEDRSQTRNFLTATAASFHRLNTFQRSNTSTVNQHKSVIINRKGECNLHQPKRRNSSTASICYGDQYDDTSEDECGGLEGINVYKLKHLNHSQQKHSQTDKQFAQSDFCDNHSLVSLSDSTPQIPQVPIIVVLIILTCYVCLGTVTFALWENWSLIDGAYFCFVTLTTIGYGDFVPWQTFQGPEIQLFACCAYLLVGLVLVAMSFSILETQLIWKCKRLAVRLKLAKE